MAENGRLDVGQEAENHGLVVAQHYDELATMQVQQVSVAARNAY